MKVLIRKDSNEIRIRLEQLGYTACEKAMEGIRDGLYINKSDNTFHVKSEWDVIRMFVETGDWGEDKNMFCDFLENDIIILFLFDFMLGNKFLTLF